MTLQQLQYILSINRHRHFARAAEACHVTQATLSTMVQKLEAELQVQIFDRSRHPVVPTPFGERILAKAREICQHATQLEEMVREERDALAGEVRLGVIPTVAPYLLPAFLQQFARAHPAVRWQVAEHTTANLQAMLARDELDLLILATEPPPGMVAHFLKPDNYVLYLSPRESLLNYPAVLLQHLEPAHLWLLAEGNCMRTQVLSLCDLTEQCHINNAVRYEAGSLETLKQLVDVQGGYTLLPELMLPTLTDEQRRRVRPFEAPAPSRNLVLVHTAGFARKKLVKTMVKMLQE